MLDINLLKEKHIMELLRTPSFILHASLMVVHNVQIKTELTKLNGSILGDLTVIYAAINLKDLLIERVVVVMHLEDAWTEIER